MPEREPRPVEELQITGIDKASAIAARVTALKREARTHGEGAAFKLGMSVPFFVGGGVTYHDLFENVKNQQDVEHSVFFLAATVVTWLAGLGTAKSGLEDLQEATQARSEANALTTALAQHLLATGAAPNEAPGEEPQE